jgi:hypothetical protein
VTQQLTLGSSSISTIRQPRLTLSLDIGKADGSSTTESIEMTKDELDSLINALDKMNHV